MNYSDPIVQQKKIWSPYNTIQFPSGHPPEY